MNIKSLPLILVLISLTTSCTENFLITNKVAPPDALSTPKAPFISVWSVNSNEQIYLYTRQGYNYDFEVDWGDSTSSRVTSHDDPDIYHTYESSGNYTVKITGLAEAWYSNGGDCSTLVEVVDLGDLGWLNLGYAFADCYNLTSFAGGKTNLVTNMEFMFSGTSTLTNIDLSSFNTVNVTNMNSMFSSASVLLNLDVSNFNTSNVINMSYMFAGLPVTSLDLSSFDTSSVSNMNLMFSWSAITSLNTTNWNVSLAGGSSDPFDNADPGIVVTCNQGGSPGTGSFFGKPCQ
jgi:surface protein